ncbi:hypothetical protein [Nonomuraea sp. NPDC050643]|uniref:hypothetical protein n=1 Tax=Nonomuraea sp. NPDC050643 TaxID=3155660 RepID=UPI0033D6E3E8
MAVEGHWAGRAIPADRLWANPGCGLKTCGRPEVRASLENLVAAARRIRTEVTGFKAG